MYELNQESQRTALEKRRMRKQVISILSEVLDHRQLHVKQQLAKKLTSNISGGNAFKKSGLVPATQPMSLL